MSLQSSDPIIIPNNANSFLNTVQATLPPAGTGRRLGQDVNHAVISVEHKLNTVRFMAGLIQNIDEAAFSEFERHLLQSQSGIPHLGTPQQSTHTRFLERAEFTMYDLKEYRLFLMFFLEAFSAGATGLLDNCAFILERLFSLQMQEKDITFIRVLDQSKIKNSNLYGFLKKYKENESNNEPWVNPLKQIRNRTSHRPITEVCGLMENERTLYSSPPPVEFVLNQEMFPPNTSPSERNLKSFVESCFHGLVDFVEEFYISLSQEIQSSGTLPF
ncbi:MAG: hypothetical protein KDJ97_17630 [Anaerolineae bacterium]|nr:hypothetical protein [Anaerolineae bacterium]